MGLDDEPNPRLWGPISSQRSKPEMTPANCDSSESSRIRPPPEKNTPLAVPPPHQARQAAGQERGRCRTGSIETITYDNGKEFASHVEIATSLGSLSYFAKPYHSWEGGLNEHTNGLFRQASQKVQISLLCPIPMSKGSRIKSTLAPERYSAIAREVFFNT
jgi:hypothetical protein